MIGSAVISDCGLFRFRLDRFVGSNGPVYAFFGVNGSTATGDEDDHTVRKWNGFTRRWGASRYIVGNAFGFRATDVTRLAAATDPIGPDNDRYLSEIAAEADVLVPCWGSRNKLPPALRPRLDAVLSILTEARKPLMCFGLTKTGDPIHPLMLGYGTRLVPFGAAVPL